MQSDLEDLEYQRRDTTTIVVVLVGKTPNNFDSFNFFGIHTNASNL